MFRIALLLILPAALLSAQGRLRAERPRLGARVGAGAGARSALFRDRVVAHIHQLRKDKIQQALGVSADKAGAIADRWTQFDQDSAARRQDMKQLREQVNGILVGPGSEDEKNTKLRPMVERLSTLQKQQQETKRAFEEDIRAGLTPAQQARFILLVEEFQRSLQEAIAEQQKGK
jgi:hypothetical protein